jgi:lysophospholipase L1-like esterase
MYQMVYEHGANLVIMTINETGRLKTNDPRDADRHYLNTLIQKYAWENHWAGGRRTFCVDINAAIPWHRPDLEEKKKIWDDGMHLTPKGYDLIGALIFQAIVDHLNLKDI